MGWPLYLNFKLITAKFSFIRKFKNFMVAYPKVPKFSNVRKLCCNLPKIHEKRPNLRVFRQKMQMK